mgnify:CR=1 FL=1
MEIKTGMVVEIKDAFFKNDNGFYFVEHSAGDPDWCGSDHSLRKISKRGKISQAKHNLCFWPIGIFISDRFKAPKREPGIKNTRQSKSEPKSTVQKLPPTLTRWPKTSPIRSSAKPGTMAKKARL